jgi:hypothetical protein
MTERSAYLRDQADKLHWHADHMIDAETKEQLRKLAIEYIERAAINESEGPSNVRKLKVVPQEALPVTSEPLDVLHLQRTIDSLEKENGWLKEQLARIIREK